MTDYTSINSSVTFHPGLNNITVTINTTDDELVEPREEFDAILSVSDHDAGRVTVLNGLSTIAITDNDRKSCDNHVTLFLMQHVVPICILENLSFFPNSKV